MKLENVVDWHGAKCDGVTDKFYPGQVEEKPERIKPELWDEPRAICATCSLTQQCLEYAIINQERHGMWGGKTTVEIKQIRMSRRRQYEHNQRTDDHVGAGRH